MLEVGKTYKSKAGSPVTIVAQFDGCKFAGIYDHRLLRAYDDKGREFQHSDGSGNVKDWAGNIELEVRKKRYLTLGSERCSQAADGNYTSAPPLGERNPVVRLDYLNGKLVSAVVVNAGADGVDWSGNND